MGDVNGSLRRKLVDYLQDAHAMEQNVRMMLSSMISTTTDAQVRARLEQHRTETDEHERRIRQRLEALGANVSTMKDVPAILGAMVKGVADQMRGDKPGRNARDAYVSEHLEIAAYQLLERFAVRIGDDETARIARENRSDEEEMARYIDGNWDRFLELTLAEVS